MIPAQPRRSGLNSVSDSKTSGLTLATAEDLAGRCAAGPSPRSGADEGTVDYIAGYRRAELRAPLRCKNSAPLRARRLAPSVLRHRI
jgi:hypothetical protein